MRNATNESALMHNWPTHQIPHVIDCDAFKPMNMDQARAILGLPQNIPLILFISSGGIHDTRKGWDLLHGALPAIRDAYPKVEVVVLGPITPGYQSPKGITIHWVGQVSGDAALSLYYNGANVTAVPSREDNMPLTAMEAQSCGRAVVGFSVGGLPDIVGHEQTGFLASPGDVEGLAFGLINAIADSIGGQVWGKLARERAGATWSRQVVIPRYLAVYEQALV